tara:strand:+ start:25917 stop:27029 length:1113 start_codon:yes stop_codon:yes gene_type:complete
LIHVLADQNLYKIEDLIPPEADLSLYDPSQGIPDPKGFDALLVRTVTHLNEQTIPSIPNSLKFIGTGSSGTDHLDNEYLESQGITLANANGCNARAVAEYVLTSLLLWREKYQPKQNFGKVGVIGVGKAGSAVVQLLSECNIESVEFDPPREERDPDFRSASLEEVLDCDILTFHVPLNRKGNYPTYHWLNEKKLSGQKYKLIINAARGGVIDETALKRSYEQGNTQQYVLDVWEGEPNLNPEIAKHAFIATPHIAGYSEQAKVNATRIVCQKMMDFFGLEQPSVPFKIDFRTEQLAGIKNDLSEILNHLHPISGYDEALRELLDQPDKDIQFRELRNNWPYRLEYPSLKIPAMYLDEFPELSKLGIRAH